MPFSSYLQSGAVLCHNLPTVLNKTMENYVMLQFTVPKSNSKAILMVYDTVYTNSTHVIIWNTNNFANLNTLSFPDFLPLHDSVDFMCITYNAEILVLRDPTRLSVSLVDISNMAQAEVFSSIDLNKILRSFTIGGVFGVAISQDGTTLFVQTSYKNQSDTGTELSSFGVSPVLMPTPLNFIAGGPFSSQVYADETNGGFWLQGTNAPYLWFYSLNRQSLQLQPVPFQNNPLSQANLQSFTWIKLIYGNVYILTLGQFYGNTKTLISVAKIHSSESDIYFTNTTTWDFVDDCTIGICDVSAMGAKYIITLSYLFKNFSYFRVDVFQLENEITPLASVNFFAAFLRFLPNNQMNFGFNFLVLQTEPVLKFSTPVCYQNIGHDDTAVLEFEYNYSSQALIITKNITVIRKQYMVENKVVQGYFWILAEEPNTSYSIFQISANYSVCCFLGSFKIAPVWEIDRNSTRLLIVSATFYQMYDISMCQCTDQSMSRMPKIIYTYTAPYQFGFISLYTLQERGSGIVVASTNGQGLFQLLTDCPPGRHPTSSNFCTACIPGQSGAYCSPCPAGYLCNEFGMSVPSEMCPAGHYCEAGSFGAPPPCDAGKYCPAGVATQNVTEALNSAKLCAAGFYCPSASRTPTAVICPQFTFSAIGASSIWNCTCIQGFYGFGGACLQCPPQCECNGSSISNCWLPSGFSVLDLAANSVQPLLCPSYTIAGGNQCNRNKAEWYGTGDFPCEKGYQNRMCAQCSSGYFADGRRCYRCKPYLQWLLPLVYFVFTVGIGIIAWYDSPSDSASIKIVLFHFQFLFALITSGLQWNEAILHVVHSSSSASSLSYMAIECLIKGWGLMGSLLFALFTPILAIFLGCITWCFSWIIVLLPTTAFAEPKRSTRILKVAVFVVTLRFFDMATIFFSMFACTSYNSRTGEAYLNSYPWVSCGSDDYAGYVSVAIIGSILEIVGLPLLYFVSTKAYRSRLTEGDLMEVIGSLYAIYSPLHYYWETVVISRRLLIAFIIALVPFNNSWLYFGFFIVMLGYLVAHMKYSPYARPVDNLLEFTSQVVLLISLFVGLLISVPLLHQYQFSFSIILLVLNLAFLLCGGTCIARSYIGKLRAWWRGVGNGCFKSRKYTRIAEVDQSNLSVGNL